MVYSDNSLEVPVLILNRHWIHHGRSLDYLDANPSYITIAISVFPLPSFLPSVLPFFFATVYYYGLLFFRILHSYFTMCVPSSFILCKYTKQNRFYIRYFCKLFKF